MKGRHLNEKRTIFLEHMADHLSKLTDRIESGRAITLRFEAGEDYNADYCRLYLHTLLQAELSVLHILEVLDE